MENNKQNLHFSNMEVLFKLKPGYFILFHKQEPFFYYYFNFVGTCCGYGAGEFLFFFAGGGAGLQS